MVSYEEPVFRPPAEGRSVIIQATIECSWNKCAFCEMYTSKKFKVRRWDELKQEIKVLSSAYEGVKKIFLADGNAFVLSANRLIPVLEEINRQFGKIRRISSYALPNDIAQKSLTELKQIRTLGLKLLYIGIESGNDELLRLVNKGETHHSTVEGILKAHEAGIDTSIMVINGLGGRKYSEQHAVDSARLVNKINPGFLSTLTLSLPFGELHYKTRFRGEYIPQTIVELAEELRLFISHVNIRHTIFRSDHISNNLILKGVLSEDKESILRQIDDTIRSIDNNEYPVCPPTL